MTRRRCARRIGVNATGLPFNLIMAVELNERRMTNPTVNTGALAATSLVPGATAEAKWRRIQEGLSAFAGRSLTVNAEVLASTSTANHRNLGLVAFLKGYDRLYLDPVETLDRYTHQSSLNVTAGPWENSGDWLFDVGLPSKSGVGGGILAVAPASFPRSSD